MTTRIKDGVQWCIGSDDEVRWINQALNQSTQLETELPLLFSDYCRIGLPDPLSKLRKAHNTALVRTLRCLSTTETWWLGYLEYGLGVNLVFNNAPFVTVFTWHFMLVKAGPDQALAWRGEDSPELARKGPLPELIFPADHSWLYLTPWDDFHTDIGGSAALISALTQDSELRSFSTRLC